jgi:hypothetical protein
MTSAPETLQRIQEALNRPTDVLPLIEQFVPRTLPDAMIWAGRRPVWDEYRGQFPDQVIDIARVISRRAMREFGLSFSEDGRVLKPRTRAERSQPPGPTEVFRLSVRGEPVKVEYKPDYMPVLGEDLFSFESPFEPDRPHPLSDTDFWAHFVRSEVVTACGGPRAYAVRLAEAKIRGELEALEADFEGRFPEDKSRRRKRGKQEHAPAGQSPPVLGKHTEKVVAEDSLHEDGKPPSQQSLFS